MFHPTLKTQDRRGPITHTHTHTHTHTPKLCFPGGESLPSRASWQRDFIHKDLKRAAEDTGGAHGRGLTTESNFLSHGHYQVFLYSESAVCCMGRDR